MLLYFLFTFLSLLFARSVIRALLLIGCLQSQACTELSLVSWFLQKLKKLHAFIFMSYWFEWAIFFIWKIFTDWYWIESLEDRERQLPSRSAHFLTSRYLLLFWSVTFSFTALSKTHGTFMKINKNCMEQSQNAIFVTEKVDLITLKNSTSHLTSDCRSLVFI